MSPDDRYARFDYSRLISWDPRLAREWGFLEPLLASAPEPTVLDLGAGTGEHARFLAAKGFDVLGVDASVAMVDKARARPAAGVSFVLGDMRDVASIAGPPRGAALCVGNALPHLTEEGDLHRLASGLAAVLLAGALVVLQILNYGRFAAKGERALPVSVLPDPDDPDAAIVFVRTLRMLDGGRVVFMPSVLREDPRRDPPLELLASQKVEIRGWRRAEIERAFRDAGFVAIEAFGSYQRAPFDEAESRDLILLARRP